MLEEFIIPSCERFFVLARDFSQSINYGPAAVWIVEKLGLMFRMKYSGPNMRRLHVQQKKLDPSDLRSRSSTGESEHIELVLKLTGRQSRA